MYLSSKVNVLSFKECDAVFNGLIKAPFSRLLAQLHPLSHSNSLRYPTERMLSAAGCGKGACPPKGVFVWGLHTLGSEETQYIKGIYWRVEDPSPWGKKSITRPEHPFFPLLEAAMKLQRGWSFMEVQVLWIWHQHSFKLMNVDQNVGEPIGHHIVFLRTRRCGQMWKVFTSKSETKIMSTTCLVMLTHYMTVAIFCTQSNINPVCKKYFT